MTCIVGIQAGGKVWLGGDSAVTMDSSGFRIKQGNPKVFKRGPLVIAICGATRWESILQHRIMVPNKIGADIDAWMATEISGEIRKIAREEDLLVNGAFEGSGALFGVQDRLYYMDGDLGTWPAADGYAAMGSGSGPAAGALRIALKYDNPKTPAAKLKAALETAEVHTSYVYRPFRVEHT
jgi:ATP-dependent protease HslVU (ClpYQ) peptidase subunit